MRLFFKKASVVGLAICAVLIIAGCTETEDGRQVADDQPLISEIKNERPMPLADVIANNDEALQLATDTVSVNAPDEFLVYVDHQKQRDRNGREPDLSASLDGLGASMADALASMAQGLAGALSGLLAQAPAVTPPPAPTPPKPPETPPVVEPPNQYVSDDDGFSITFPDGWRITEKANGDKNTVKAEDTTENGAYLENIVVEVEELPLESDLGEYADQVIDELGTDLVDFTEIERGETTVHGIKAKEIVYSHRADGRTLKVLMYVFPFGLKGHVITCSAEESKYSKYEAAFKKSAASFKFQ